MLAGFTKDGRVHLSSYLNPGSSLLLIWIVLFLLFHLFFSVDKVIDCLPVFCPFKILTGIPCPGCGMTRAFLAFAEGDFLMAFQYNPFSTLLFIIIILSSFDIHLPVPQGFKRCFYTASLIGIVLWWFLARLVPNIA